MVNKHGCIEPFPRFIGPYRLVEPLGRGGMGVVYRGEHVRDGTEVALKTIRALDEMHLDAIRQEIRALARLNHPGIVKILDEGVHDGLPWYAMELLAGRSLRAFLSQDSITSSHASNYLEHNSSCSTCSSTGRREFMKVWSGLDSSDHSSSEINVAVLTSWERVRSGGVREERASVRGSRVVTVGLDLHQILCLVRSVCLTLSYLHGEGLVHRDIKPDNIFVRENGTPVLVDFGLIFQFSADISRERLVVERGWRGSLDYLAPEQVSGQFSDARTDLYSLGCVLFELVTGYPPYMKGMKIIRRGDHSETVPAPASQFNPEVTPELDELLMHLLEKRPQARLGYADAVAAVLTGMLGDDGAEDRYPVGRTYLYRSRCVGRDGQMEQLFQHRDLLIGGRGGVLFIQGECGVGKTRLVMEFGREAALHDILVLTGDCSSLKKRHLEALLKPLRRLSDRCRERGRAETVRLFGVRAKIFERYDPSFGDLPDFDLLPEPAALPANAARLRLFGYIKETLALAAEEQPVMVILDDLQWADELVLDFLEFTLKTHYYDSMQLLFVCVTRSESIDGQLQRLRDFAGVQHMSVERLEEKDVSTMISDMLAIDPAPAVFAAFLARVSSGNPFFVAEYVRAAVDEGVLWRDNLGNWHVAVENHAGVEHEQMYDMLTLPTSLQELIEVRLDRLSYPGRDVLSAAAILGYDEADPGIVRAMVGLNRGDFLDSIEELKQATIIEKRLDGSIGFIHQQVREQVVAQYDPELLPGLHRTAAECTEALKHNNLDHLQTDLGRHWQEAGEPEKAMPYYLSAARNARERYAYEEAERLYRSYLQLVSCPTTESVSVRNEFGSDILSLFGRHEEAISQYSRALEEAVQVGDRNAAIESTRLLGLAYFYLGTTEKAHTLLEQALDAASDQANQQATGKILGNLAVFHNQEGRCEMARALYEQVLIISRASCDPVNVAKTLCNLATLFHQQGELEQAIGLYKQARSLSIEQGDYRFEGRILANLANVYTQQKKFRKAHKLYTKALTIAEEVGDPGSVGRITSILATLDT